MAELNKHGLPMHGIRAVSDQIFNCPFGSRFDVFYDLSDGSVFVKYVSSPNSFFLIDNDNTIFVCSTTRRLTMQQLADAVQVACFTAS